MYELLTLYIAYAPRPNPLTGFALEFVRWFLLINLLVACHKYLRKGRQ